MERAAVADWIDGYERAWRTAGTTSVRDLFTDNATYSIGPYEPTETGVDAIASLWDRERVSADEQFTMVSDIVAVEGSTAVARVQVDYLDTGEQFRDLWIIRFDADGRCAAFEEWPFWPDQTITPTTETT